MTLMELLVALGIASVLLTATASLAFYTSRSFAAVANYVELDTFSRNALDSMSREIRQTRKLKEGTDSKLVFEDGDGKDLVYTYDSATRSLTRTKNGVADPKPLLKQCDFLKFSMYQRNPMNGKYDQYPTADASTCKLVQLRWICSRDLVYAKRNTESVQSAKIVIRKQ
jgi:type II secretory pathway component PulJ